MQVDLVDQSQFEKLTADGRREHFEVLTAGHRQPDPHRLGRTTGQERDPVGEAVQIALDAAGGKNVEVFSPTIGRQLLEMGLIDEIDLHIAPILLGDGIRLYDNPSGVPIRLHRLGDGDPNSALNARYRPVTSR